jgi:cytidylate kinase
MTERVVAIDGAAGSGKSTLACSLARRLGLAYVNTGLMYRALTLEARRRSVDPGDSAGLVTLMQGLRFTLGGSDPVELWIDGGPPEAALSAAEVEVSVSQVSAHPVVRAGMRDEQRRLGMAGAVMEGRDIGSVVFPDAAVKLYLQADPGERIARRVQDRPEAGSDVGRDLSRRDDRDAGVNPMRPSPGATMIDTTRLDEHQTLQAALDTIRAQAPALVP